MQLVNSSLQAEIDKGLDEPRVLVSLYEFYDHDAVPGVDGFDPADAEETFAGQEITWNGVAYRRSVISRGDVSRNMGEKTNSVNINFSNIDRYVATWAQTQQVEGMILVVRCVNPDVQDDSLTLFVGRCDKPGDITKNEFSLTARQDFGNINVIIPTSQYVAEDPNGLTPDNPLYEGIRFVPLQGMTNPTGGSPGRSGLLGALLGGIVGWLITRKKKVAPVSTPWSSYDFTPYGQVVSEVFGTVQMQGVPLMFKDTGYWLDGLWAWCKGPIQGVTNIQIKNFTAVAGPDSLGYGMYEPQTHTGELGGTGAAIVRNFSRVPQTGGNSTEDHRFPGSGFFSLLAFTGLNFLQSGINDEPITIDEPPMVVGLVQGRKIDLPDGSGSFVRMEWSDNPVYHSRFIFTNERFANINPAFMDDAVIANTGLHCDEPLIDLSNSQTIIIPTVETAQAGESFKRFQTTALITPENVKYVSGDLTEPAAPEPTDGPYTPLPSGPIPETFDTVPVLQKRYTASFSISEEVKAVDFVQKTLFPAAKLYMKVGKTGKVGIYTKKPSSTTKVRTATVVGATSIPVLDVTPWKTGLELLTGRLLVGWSLTTSEVRDLVSADYSTSGNSVTLESEDTGTTTLTASGATLSGGSTSAQASGTLAVGGAPAAGDTITAVIDGVEVEYTLTSADDTETAAAMLMNYINATATLKPYIKASWLAASPNVITIKCLHGALNLSSTTGFSTLLKAHEVGETVLRVAMSFSDNSQDIYSSWYPSTLVLLNDIQLPTVLNNRKYQATSLTTGITAASEPTWPTTAGGTVVDGGVTWTETGSTVLAQAGLRRSNIVKDSLQWPKGGTQSSVNVIEGEFRDKVLDYALHPFKVKDQTHYNTVKKWLSKKVDYTAVDNWNQVYRLANGELAENREGDWFAGWATGAQGLPLEEGDLVCFSSDSGGLINVAVRIEDLRIRPNHEVVIGSARLYSDNMYSDDVVATPITIPSTLRQTQTTSSVAVFIDNFAIRDADALVPGFYIAVSRDLAIAGDWRGWSLWADYGDGYRYLTSGDIAATIGTADTILGSADPDVFDTWQTFTSVFGTDVITVTGHRFANGNSVQVKNVGGALPPPLTANTTYFVRDVSGDTFKLAATPGGAVIDLITNNGTGTHSIKSVLELTLQYGTPEPAPAPFATVTEAELIANPYRNLFQYGSEYLQAATVVSHGDQSYTVSDYYRGRFGTNTTELIHVADEDIVFLNGAEKFVEIDPARSGIAYNYKVVTTNQNVADADHPISFTWTGGTVKGPNIALALFLCFFDSSNDNALFEWAGTSAQGPSSRESYDFEVRNLDDDTTLSSRVITPSLNTELSEIPPMEGISPDSDYLTPGAYFFVGNGSSTMFFDPNEHGNKTGWIRSKAAIGPVGGMLVETEVLTPSVFEVDEEGGGGASGIFPRYFALCPSDFVGGPDPGTGLVDGCFYWQTVLVDDVYYTSPETRTGVVNPAYQSIPGDRLAIEVRPDGTVAYYINRLGPSSQPYFVSPFKVDLDELYYLNFVEPAYTSGIPDNPSAPVLYTVVRTRWVRQGPEFLYTGAAQEVDGVDGDPSITARVRQHSFVAGGPPGAWTTKVFPR
jgi:hypothetical protein